MLFISVFLRKFSCATLGSMIDSLIKDFKKRNEDPMEGREHFRSNIFKQKISYTGLTEDPGMSVTFMSECQVEFETAARHTCAEWVIFQTPNIRLNQERTLKRVMFSLKTSQNPFPPFFFTPFKYILLKQFV